MLRAILTFLKSLFSFGEKVAENKGLKIPLQEESIKSESHKDAVKDEVRIDQILDKKLRNERKIVYEFDERVDFLKSLGTPKQVNIYFGTKEQVMEEVKTDPARVISGTRKFGEQRDILRKIDKSLASWFIVAIHPLTVH